MPKVIYRAAHLPEEIDGIKYTPHPDEEGAAVSENMSQEAADRLATIEGFTIVGAPPAKQQQPEDPAAKAAAKAAADAKRAELVDRAKAVGMTVSKGWSVERLEEQVVAAEKAAAESKGTGGNLTVAGGEGAPAADGNVTATGGNVAAAGGNVTGGAPEVF